MRRELLSLVPKNVSGCFCGAVQKTLTCGERQQSPDVLKDNDCYGLGADLRRDPHQGQLRAGSRPRWASEMVQLLRHAHFDKNGGNRTFAAEANKSCR